MKNDLTDAQLDQEVTVALPLRAVLTLGRADLARKACLTADRLAIGRKGMHGIYAGIARATDSMPDRIIEVLDQSPKLMTWQAAQEWARSIGGELPTRKEQALLFANVPELFEQAWYWSCEQYAGDESFAWCQGFYYGAQDYGPKSNELRARAVRRLNLQ